MTAAVLVEYGRLGHVGAFAGPAAAGCVRDSAVIVRGPRGVELGRVLGASTGAGLNPAAGGDCLRVASDADLARAAASDQLAAAVLAAATDAALELPVAVLDCEPLFGGGVVLHVLPWAACDCDPLAASLTERFNIPVRVFDVSPVPEPAAPAESGCGSCSTGGCSSGGTGGCSTGGCSRKAVKSAGELSAYFADLRGQMDARASARTPLA